MKVFEKNDVRILTYAIVVALGGFLFGFDTAVISGAEQEVQRIWGLTAIQHGFTVSIALIGTVIGALFGGIPSERLGRKYSLFWIAVLYWISAVGSALATDWNLFLFFRFMGGIGVGVSSVTAPLYISEIAPARSRGKLVALFQFNIVFGILIAYLSNYGLADMGEMAWRWMLGVEAIPALIFLFAVLFVPKSPRWLIVKQGKVDEARDILLSIRDHNLVEAEINSILNSSIGKEERQSLWNTKYKTQIFLVVCFAFFNQLSGINAIIYYAPRIFEMAEMGKSGSLISTIGIGVVNFCFTLLALAFIDRFGRRFLMLVGSFGLIITLGLISWSFYIRDFGSISIYFFIYIAFFAFSQGAVIWVFISEIFPNKVRAAGQALGSFTHWILAAAVALIFPYITKHIGPSNTFLIFTSMMILQLLFVWKAMPETKGKSLEEIEAGDETVAVSSAQHSLNLNN
ncbi:sugar porter family MFS transporter [Marinoscillum sp. 108]|uniref:sugar porter family MFS transporter n=1 Tax=Marinoscillum sp. 108 TaxID=2653151 RepID=UPI0012F12F8A|nr:sugar porter family MFS transporter [Marinoscillum sp. 108]VXD21278.1 MFS transporter [Marinoscillum sp. 108]